MKSASGSKRPVRIDEFVIDQHRHLLPSDVCYYFREYQVGAGYAGETNSLILNFKKTPDLADRPEWIYKAKATEVLAGDLAACFESKRDYFAAATIVPMPPSRGIADRLYDDRLSKLLYRVAELCTFALDVQELLKQKRSTLSSSREAKRLAVEELIELYEVEGIAQHRIIILDDVLTTGAHFRAAKHHLQVAFPSAVIVGMFLARAIRS